ncbi:hypothetical protein FisN_11Lu359 [Fistulifera solaris]|uniref:Uncharacterized protein n=1 Tax=Fistulifera solaris TaxID=1519565 RepID=A0A1Z5K0K8_FISSO|nr:hypothetical protein FisN_11Lu359 [Fistulifera solaris]|eukprot:GAX19787.1 hypothetical protein FisN_11Lu359 [Fistulifera solaris]
MTARTERKVSRTLIALVSTLLLFVAATFGVYNMSFETLFDRNMLHQCNGPQRGILLESGQTSEIAALPIGLFRLYYLAPSNDRRDFCSCEVSCQDGNVNLYMTDYEGYWIYPEFLNDWNDGAEYECVAESAGNAPESCDIRGIGDDWYCYIMLRARTSLTNCTLTCGYE